MSDFGWTPQAASRDRFSFSDVVPDEILYEYDGPRIFTKNASEGLLLFYMSAESDGALRYIVSPATDILIEDLRVGAKTVLELLEQSLVWVVDTDLAGSIQNVWRTTSERIPARSLPRPGVMLYPDLQPIVSLRYSGPAFEHGSLKASVLQETISRAVEGLRKLGNREPIVQRLQVGSLEIDFAADRPNGSSKQLLVPGLSSDELSGFERSLEIASNENTEFFDVPSRHLAVLGELALPQSSGLNKLEIGGVLFKSDRKFVIDESMSRRIHQAIKARRSEDALSYAAASPTYHPETLVGQLRRFDKDAMTFYIKRAGKKSATKCKFRSEHLDTALNLFANDTPSEASGYSDGRVLLVDRVRAVPSLPDMDSR